MFGSLENKGKRREKRENQTLNEAARYLHKNKLCQKIASVYKIGGRGGGGGGGGGGGAYIGHLMYETTKKPNMLAKLRDKIVIHQKLSRFALITKG